VVVATKQQGAAAHDGFMAGGAAWMLHGGQRQVSARLALDGIEVFDVGVNEYYTVTLMGWASQPIRVRGDMHRRKPLADVLKNRHGLRSTAGACATTHAMSLLCPQPSAPNPSPLPPSPIQEEDLSSPPNRLGNPE
jgi:hypothetical protein